MIGCTQTITLIQRISNTATDNYRKVVISGASWHEKAVVELQDKGIKSADMIKVRIPEANLPAGIVLANGDCILKGTFDGEIARIKDLEGIDYHTIISVGDNRRGSLRHWAVIAK